MMNNNQNSTDYGPEPFVTNIDNAAKQNKNYRTTLWSGRHLQLTLMSIKDEIGLELHNDTDQFLRIEYGVGMVMMGKNKDNLNFQTRVGAGSAIFVPAGTWHNVINRGKSPLKIYTVYAPPHHPRGTVHHTKEEAEHSGD